MKHVELQEVCQESRQREETCSEFFVGHIAFSMTGLALLLHFCASVLRKENHDRRRKSCCHIYLSHKVLHLHISSLEITIHNPSKWITLRFLAISFESYPSAFPCLQQVKLFLHRRLRLTWPWALSPSGPPLSWNNERVPHNWLAVN